MGSGEAGPDHLARLGSDVFEQWAGSTRGFLSWSKDPGSPIWAMTKKDNKESTVPTVAFLGPSDLRG